MDVCNRRYVFFFYSRDTGCIYSRRQTRIVFFSGEIMLEFRQIKSKLFHKHTQTLSPHFFSTPCRMGRKPILSKFRRGAISAPDGWQKRPETAPQGRVPTSNATTEPPRCMCRGDANPCRLHSSQAQTLPIPTTTTSASTDARPKTSKTPISECHCGDDKKPDAKAWKPRRSDVSVWFDGFQFFYWFL